jgi:hypothetical protein
MKSARRRSAFRHPLATFGPAADGQVGLCIPIKPRHEEEAGTALRECAPVPRPLRTAEFRGSTSVRTRLCDSLVRQSSAPVLRSA